MTSEPTPSPQSYPLPPGNFGLPILGESLTFLRDVNFANKRQQKYGYVIMSGNYCQNKTFLSIPFLLLIVVLDFWSSFTENFGFKAWA